ncbi:hypothetical protein HK107_08015 [Parvularcula sp. ZS-1/3]|uniref:Uncharacterized protein n=1 Tax=Parvularcula mediterranea TaxID=2732508 RepID=A0A7Y3RLM0_9PROT|nr:hypothetical protein [Parvularcula mediterranea]NNU16264.1 hypothetical protein [Parvularcula mediterranea]
MTLTGTDNGDKLLACIAAAFFGALPFLLTVVMAPAALVIGPLCFIIAVLIGYPLALGVEERFGLTLWRCVGAGAVIGTVPLVLLFGILRADAFFAQHGPQGLGSLAWHAVLGLRSVAAFTLAGASAGAGFWLTLRVLDHRRKAAALA